MNIYDLINGTVYIEQKGDDPIIFVILVLFVIGLSVLSYKATHNHKDEEI